MTEQRRLAQAETLRSETELMLCRDGFLPLIESFGEATVIGSYALGLMTRRDIDISLRLLDEGDIGAFFVSGVSFLLASDCTRCSSRTRSSERSPNSLAASTGAFR